jgi:hypothetical protein
LEEAGTWYYVVDCATCKTVIPFKHAPEGEPILRFPTMRVRCFHCHKGHRYAPDLISHRKAAAPRGILQRASDAGESDQLASREGQEDRGLGTLEGPMIVEREIDCLRSSFRRANILIVAISGKKSTIFFVSSCFFAAGWISQLALDTLYPVPHAVLNELRLPGPAMLVGTAIFGTILLGLAFFIFGIGSFLVETFGFKGRLIKGEFARIDFYIASLAVHLRSTVALFLTETWQRNFPTRELPPALQRCGSSLAEKGSAPKNEPAEAGLSLCNSGKRFPLR